MGDARALLADVPVDAGIARAGGNRDLEPLPAAPARRHDEVAATYAPPGNLRRRLLQALIRRVPPVGHRPALIGHPGVQVSAGDAAHSDDTPVAIAVAQRALHRRGGPRFAHEGLGWRLRHKLRSCRRRGSSAPTPVRRCGGAGCAARQFGACRRRSRTASSSAGVSANPSRGWGQSPKGNKMYAREEQDAGSARLTDRRR